MPTRGSDGPTRGQLGQIGDQWGQLMAQAVNLGLRLASGQFGAQMGLFDTLFGHMAKSGYLKVGGGQFGAQRGQLRA